MRLRIAIVSCLGLALTLYLVSYVGLGAVLAAALAAGLGGFALLCVCSLATFALLGTAWSVLLPDSARVPVRVFVWARLVREAAADILPFSNFGGMVFGARAAILHRVPSTAAFASMIVDVTTELLGQVAFIALGFLLVCTRPRATFPASLSKIYWIGLVLAAAAGALFLVLQRHGHQVTLKLAARLLPRAVASAAGIGDGLNEIYASRTRVGVSSATHLAAWIAGACVTWLAFHLIGAHIDLAAVLAIESLVCAVRSAAVLVPSALGVQEATYAALAPLFGVGAEFGLAVSLLKRARDIAIGVPILLVSQTMEGRRALGNVSNP